MIVVFSYFAMILSIVGTFFVNRKNITGLYIWLIGSTIWVILSFCKKDYAQLIMFIIYLYFNIDGIIRWSKK